MALPRSLPARIAVVVGAAFALLLILGQIFLPGLGAGAIEDRLTERGGAADVRLGAMPAARLLWGDGDELTVAATGLDLELDTTDPHVLEDLDRFGEVEIVMQATQAGPVTLDSFVLARDGDDPYSLEASGATSVADVAEFLAEDADVPGADILGGLVGATGVGGSDLPLDFDMTIESDGGRIRVIEGGGKIAGIPAGPLAELITNAIVVRL